MAYASFDDYRGLYRGRAIRNEEDFNRLELRAEAVLNRLTFGRAPKYQDRENRLRLACCAVTEKLQELTERETSLSRETVGDYSVSYRGPNRQADLAELTAPLEKPFSVVANIPYYITTPLITRLLSCGLPLKSVSLMVQKEVADKLLSAPGQEGWGPLAIRCQYLCEPRLALDVPAACFTPPPKVDSAFVVMPARERPAVSPRDETDFFRVVGAAFSLRRKTLVNALCATLRLERPEGAALVAAAGLPEKIRGEQLSLADFARLSDAYTQSKEEPHS